MLRTSNLAELTVPADVDNTLSPGTRLGAYEVTGVLGRGGMAQVYLARHTTLGGERALKVLHLEAPTVQERFLQEGRLQSTLRHPNIVAVHDVLQSGPITALVMEYVDGPNLQELIRLRQLTIPQVDSVIRGVVTGVKAAHDVGLVHRDLKPANVLLARTGRGFVPKVGDFGLAKADARGGPQLTRAGQVFGTPSYMAPEQFKDSRAVDLRADIFSIGCILYEMLTGALPFPGQHPFDVYERVKVGTYTPVHALRPDAPTALVEVVARCLRPDREQRFPNCAELLASMSEDETWGEQALRGLGRPAEPVAFALTDEELGRIRDSRATVSVQLADPAAPASGGVGLHEAPTVMTGEIATRFYTADERPTHLLPAPAEVPPPPAVPPPPVANPSSSAWVFAGTGAVLATVALGVAVLVLGVVTVVALVYPRASAPEASAPEGARSVEVPVAAPAPVEDPALSPAPEPPPTPVDAGAPRTRPRPTEEPAPGPTEEAAPAMGSLSVVFQTPQLTWGRVSVDGTPLDRFAPFKEAPLAAGSHRIVVTDGEGRVRHDEVIDIAPGANRAVVVGTRAPPE